MKPSESHPFVQFWVGFQSVLASSSVRRQRLRFLWHIVFRHGSCHSPGTTIIVQIGTGKFEPGRPFYAPIEANTAVRMNDDIEWNVLIGKLWIQRICACHGSGRSYIITNGTIDSVNLKLGCIGGGRRPSVPYKWIWTQRLRWIVDRVGMQLLKGFGYVLGLSEAVLLLLLLL